MNYFRKIKQKYKTGFTLAEVLITLGIVGVIVAMTIPALITSYQDKRVAVKLQAAYNILQQGFLLMINENGEIDGYGTDADSRIDTVFTLMPEYFKFTNICGHNATGCFPLTARRDKPESRGYPTGRRNYSFTLLNGMTFYLVSDGGSCEQDTTMNQSGGWEIDGSKKGAYYGTYAHACGIIYVDIDGFNGSNTADIDIFKFAIVKNGVVPTGGPKEKAYHSFSSCQSGSGVGTCAAWVLSKKNRDYLRCPAKLGWDKASKC